MDDAPTRHTWSPHQRNESTAETRKRPVDRGGIVYLIARRRHDRSRLNDDSSATHADSAQPAVKFLHGYVK